MNYPDYDTLREEYEAGTSLLLISYYNNQMR